MKCYEIDLSKLIKVTMLNKQDFKPPQEHCERYTGEYIIYVVESGTLFVYSGGEDLKLVPGDVYIFNKGEHQKPIMATECVFYYLHFETEAVSEYEISDAQYCDMIRQHKRDFIRSNIYGADAYNHIKALIKQRIHIDDKSRLDSLISIMKNNAITYGYNTPEWRISVSGAVAGFLMRLESITFGSLDKGYIGKNGRVSDTVEKIVDYIETHFCENFDSSDIEHNLLINFDYANRIFKKHTGYSIIKYRNRLRINTAKAMITDRSMEEIATDVGFSDRYYFSRCFKNFEGISPEEYRKNLKLGEKQER